MARKGFNPTNKYRAVKTEHTSPLVGKRLYDSKAEAKRAAELDLLYKAGEVLWWLPQVPFPLPGGVKYRLDFMIHWAEHPAGEDCNITFEDVKGILTPVSKLKISQVEEIYGIKIDIVK